MKQYISLYLDPNKKRKRASTNLRVTLPLDSFPKLTCSFPRPESEIQTLSTIASEEVLTLQVNPSLIRLDFPTLLNSQKDAFYLAQLMCFLESGGSILKSILSCATRPLSFIDDRGFPAKASAENLEPFLKDTSRCSSAIKCLEEFSIISSWSGPEAWKLHPSCRSQIEAFLTDENLKAKLQADALNLVISAFPIDPELCVQEETGKLLVIPTALYFHRLMLLLLQIRGVLPGFDTLYQACYRISRRATN